MPSEMPGASSCRMVSGQERGVKTKQHKPDTTAFRNDCLDTGYRPAGGGEPALDSLIAISSSFGGRSAGRRLPMN